MAKTTIINVEIREELNTAYVTYSTGTEKLYPADKLPQTVRAWLDSHKEPEPVQEPEKIDLDDDNQTQYLDLEAEKATWHPVDGAVEEEPETVEAVEEAVEEAVCKQYASSTQAELPVVAKKPELTVPDWNGLERTKPDNSMGAAEVVAFGVMMAMAVAFWGIVGLVQILMAGIETLAYWAWSRREQAAAGCRTAVRWIGSGARAMAACLPTVATRRGLLVAVRVLPFLIGLMALM